MSDNKVDCPGSTNCPSKKRMPLARFMFLASSRRRFEREELLIERLDTVHVVVPAFSLEEAQRAAMARLTRANPEARWSLSVAL